MTDSSTSPERLLAFVSQWEYECCGDPLEVDTVRDLTLTPMDADSTLDSPLAAPVTHRLEHHVPDGDERHVRARITAMWEVRRRFVEAADRTMLRASDRDEFTAIRVMKVWDDEWQPTSGPGSPIGWVVELTVEGELEPDDGPYGADA